MKQDITQYSDAELSLHFFNDEGLYRAMRRCYKSEQLRALADECFTYTEDQFDELVSDFVADQLSD
jgi:hypothetical protein